MTYEERACFCFCAVQVAYTQTGTNKEKLEAGIREVLGANHPKLPAELVYPPAAP